MVFGAAEALVGCELTDEGTRVAGLGRAELAAVTAEAQSFWPSELGTASVVPVRIQERRQVVVLAAPVPRGAPLRPDQLRMALRDIGQAQHGYYSSIEQALGLVSRRPLPMDTVLSPASVEQPRLVKRGQRVRIDAGNRAIAISATGLALRDGRLGEIVPVRNPRSERVIDAVVSDHGTVRVAIPGASGQ